jgi:6-phosphogluconolactonase
VDWTAVQVFWGDERCVPPDHPDSNYRMARETLLDHVPLPAGNVHRIRGELPPTQAAAEYERELHAFFSLPPLGAATRREAPMASFDLVLLGMGSDGHTASLYPGTLAIHETERWVTAHRVEKLDAWRITLTPPALNAAAQVTFVVSGTPCGRKAEALRQVLAGPYRPQELPAQVIRPAPGRLCWLVDREAAALWEDQERG